MRYSYGDFTTKGHGVIEYSDPSYYEDGKKTKRRSKTKSKYTTRWPAPAPMKFKSSSTKASDKSVEKEAQEIFKKRYPGQQPKKGQIKEIMKVLRKSGGKSKKQKGQKKVITNSHIKNSKPDPMKKIDERALAVFKRRFPGQKPQGEQLKKVRHEVINSRKKLGL